jgi:hypothetical protein
MGWKLSALNAGVASIRYRALYPLLALRQRNILNQVFTSGSVRNLAGLDVLVIVKSFTADDIALAQAAVENNIPVIYDLCDNVFVDGYGDNNALSPSDVVRQMAILATAFITPTIVLADILHDQFGGSLSVYVVPDGIETRSLLAEAVEVIEQARKDEQRRWLISSIHDAKHARKLAELLRTASIRGIVIRLVNYAYRRLGSVRARILGRQSSVVPRTGSAKKIRVMPPASPNNELSNQAASRSVKRLELPSASLNTRRLLWFGNHGAKHGGRFGMIDLADNKAALERIAREFDVELVVVSNNEKKFNQLIAPLAIRSRYVEWSATRLQEELSGADIVLVPNSCDAFSLCKSANRTALALVANRPVVATLTPALMPLSDCIEAGDFYEGIRNYLSDPKLFIAHLDIARELCERLYGQETIANAWCAVIDAVCSQTNGRQQPLPQLIIVANLVSDVEFITPIAAAAQTRGASATIWVGASMVRRWPYILEQLSQSGASLRIIAETEDGAVVPRFPPSVRAVLTVADTNLGPHRFSHSITKAANKAGIVTGTLQHGLENVGLTYSDDVHLIEHIEFAAQHIFVWGDLSLLHPRVKENTRRKCIPVGCPKMVATDDVMLPPIVPPGKPVVGIFENLHWHRYDDSYRTFFLDGAVRLAEAHPDITFIIKSHNAGRWLTTRFNGELTHIENLLIADPSEAQWRGLTATSMLRRMCGVITSPSTVALDAAQAGLPVAVVAHELALKNYAPLYEIRFAAQWTEFVSGLFDDTPRKKLAEASHTFVSRVVLPGDAAIRIVNCLLKSDSTRGPEKTKRDFPLIPSDKM